MQRIIAGIYEIQQQIGSGGGGIVYLGRHLRLQKQVVLKADRRTLRARPEALRREVDMLKGLSHRYIPQVYDFVQEDGITYTVMDYIEGKSLDKILKEGETISQPDVVRWACQLLEALDYLHSRPPHGILHGDIKPANIMLRPDGDICLIDYNIALALGEDGAVKVGFSRGYASPEHYGADYGSGRRPEPSAAPGAGEADASGERASARQDSEDTRQDAADTRTSVERTGTLPMDQMTTVTFARPSVSSKGSSGSVLLDVRSDIYSLGATLYHLLSGRRPAPDAKEVVSLTPEDCSPAVAEIIGRAMAPDPALRYQTAGEMRNAFLQLHKRDKRAVRHRRRMYAAFSVLTVCFLGGGFTAFAGLRQLEQTQAALALAEYSADALREGDVKTAVELAVQAVPDGTGIFDAPVTAQAQKALTDALGVYDLSDGFKDLGTVELPSAPFRLGISPGGSFLLVTYAFQTDVYDLKEQRKAAELPMRESALADALFVDDARLVCAGRDGVTAFDLAENRVLWTGGAGTMLALSSDRTAVAALDREENKVRVYQVSDGTLLAERTLGDRSTAGAYNDIFADPEETVFALNEDGSRLAVSFSDGGLSLLDMKDPENDTTVYETSDYTGFVGGFCGKTFAFAANGTGGSSMGLGVSETEVWTDGYTSERRLLLQADESGIYLADGNLLVRFDPESLQETELAFTDHANITGFAVKDGYTLAATDDSRFTFFDRSAAPLLSLDCENICDFLALSGEYAAVGNRDEPFVRVLKLENRREEAAFFYDAKDRHEEARVSADGETIMLFDYQGFRIYGKDGSLLAQEKLPEAERIYDQQFVREEKKAWLEVTWYDGTIRRYSAADGSLLSEAEGRPPNKDLYEEFFTEKYRITSPLHGVPQVFSLKSGRLAAQLEEDAYLTYVTQIDDHLLTEYVSADGERYGLLLNRDFQTLAYLPGLCDYWDGCFYFDYQAGELRKCPLYSLEELLKLSESAETIRAFGA